MLHYKYTKCLIFFGSKIGQGKLSYWHCYVGPDKHPNLNLRSIYNGTKTCQCSPDKKKVIYKTDETSKKQNEPGWNPLVFVPTRCEEKLYKF